MAIFCYLRLNELLVEILGFNDLNMFESFFLIFKAFCIMAIRNLTFPTNQSNLVSFFAKDVT